MVGSVPLNVLVIEDDADAQSNLVDILELDGYSTCTAGTAAEALDRNNWQSLFAIILDRKLPDGTAEELLPRLREFAPDAAVIIVTGFGDLGGAIAALRQGAADYILKPIDPDTIRARLSLLASHRRVTAALGQSEAALGALLEAAPCMIIILRNDFSIVHFSPFAEQLTGYAQAEVLERDYLALFIRDLGMRQTVAHEVRITLAGAPASAFEYPIRRRDGSMVWMMWNAKRLDDYKGRPAVLIVGQDITPLKEAQRKLLQSERLAAIGEMVTGLAHESRNALQRSQACLEMLALDLSDRPDALDLIGRIQKAQDHLHHLYEEVRGFAAPIHVKRRTCDLRTVLQETWEHLTVLRKERDARLDFEPSVTDLRCQADPLALEQVFRNILENSLSACEDPVRINVHCSECLLDFQPALRISLADNGPGLTYEQRTRIFEPFFTTKTSGTGLGMAIARRIVEAHGGSLSVGTDWSPGAEIVIILPCGSP